ncbi:MAG: hypothetical protein CMJ42_05925 [Phyllobacteriaceae bacterium]|nr:hypothetical protein [Phyllobacteriaceae bacterium]MBA91850.1 hypothetical protein [Phyllobacteriaceae bacterium]
MLARRKRPHVREPEAAGNRVSSRPVPRRRDAGPERPAFGAPAGPASATDAGHPMITMFLPPERDVPVMKYY